MAQQLRRIGATVALLCLLDTAAPLALSAELDEALVAAALAREEARLHGRPWRLSREELIAVPPPERLARVLGELHASGVVGPEIGLRDFRRWLAGYQARSAAQMLYQPQPYDGKITLLKASEREALAEAPAGLAARLAADDLGWSAVALQPIEVGSVRGYHVEMLAEPMVHEVGRFVAECVARALRPAAAGEGDALR